jgi:hypothetical protein
MATALSKCVICLDSIKSGSEHALKECGHLFHTECIMQWFRTGYSRCPCCNYSAPLEVSKCTEKKLMLTLSLKTARSKHAPPEMKKTYQQLRTTQVRLKNLKQLKGTKVRAISKLPQYRAFLKISNAYFRMQGVLYNKKDRALQRHSTITRARRDLEEYGKYRQRIEAVRKDFLAASREYQKAPLFAEYKSLVGDIIEQEARLGDLEELLCMHHPTFGAARKQMDEVRYGIANV